MANEKKLVDLHSMLAEEFLTQIQDGEVEISEITGEEVRKPPSAALLSAARQFLRDNHIDTNASKLTKDSTIVKLGANLVEEDEYYDPNLPEFQQ